MSLTSDHPWRFRTKPGPAHDSQPPLDPAKARGAQRRRARPARRAAPAHRRELADLAALPDAYVTSLAALAHQVRLAWCGPEVEVEGILSAKTGGCPEDCHFCCQSSRFDTPVKATPFLDADEVLPRRRGDQGRRAPPSSASCWPSAAPTSGPCNASSSWSRWSRSETGLNVAVSAGLLTDEQARRFAEGGVHRYNHNLETSRSFFPDVVTTHTWEEREETCRLVRDHGMELCCGALIGMGESDEQRIELLTQLQELDPTEVPLNFLNPRPGTPLGAEQPGRRTGRPSAGSPSSGSACPASSSATPAAAR